MDYRLYAITDCTMDRETLLRSVEQAVAGGITILQYRPKLKDIPEMLEEANLLQEILHPKNIPLIINDYADVAKLIGADGVHLGQDDMNSEAVRDYLGAGFVMGLSVGNAEELKNLDVGIVDYMGCGAVYGTNTKSDAGDAIGVSGFKKLRNSVLIPTVAIGGITYENAGAVIDAGADGIAVISQLFRSDDITQSARDLKALWG